MANYFAAHARLFQSLTLDLDSIVLAGKKSSVIKIAFLTIGSDITIERGYFWDTLAIHLEGGQSNRFGGIAKNQSRRIQKELNSQIQSYIKNYYQTIALDLRQAYLQAALLFNGQRYVRYPTAQRWLRTHEHLRDGVCRQNLSRYLSNETVLWAEFIRPFLDKGIQHIGTINDVYIHTQLSSYRGFFDQVESNPLTDNQRKACVTDEQNQHHDR